jgi:hypothetical protein
MKLLRLAALIPLASLACYARRINASLCLIGVVLVANFARALAAPTATPISPDTPFNGPTAATSTAGLTISLAGDSSTLYAISLNNGVYKSIGGSLWTKLANSPRYAYSIAIDPNNHDHIAVGERGGDAIDHHQDHAGLWESDDAGMTWHYSFDPLSQPGCTSGAIPSVAFSKTSALFVATTCGIAHRPPKSFLLWLLHQWVFTYDGSPSGIGVVTAVVTSDNKVWARTASQLLVSTDDGSSWQQMPIPGTFTFPERGDVFSLAAFDNAAYMSCCEDKTPPCGNANRLLIYSAQSGTFRLEPMLLDAANTPQLGCDGVGLGGSRFVRSFEATRRSAGGGPPIKLQGLFYGSGQEVYQASGIQPDGTVTGWIRPLGTTCKGCTNQDPVHADLWDFLLAADGTNEWVSNDGGVYKRRLFPTAGPWTQLQTGLTTHHIHTLTAGKSAWANTANLAYASSDNDAWYWSPGHDWTTTDWVGDANWTAADAGIPSIALMVRDARAGDGELTGFWQNLPTGVQVQHITLTNQTKRDGPQTFNFIQSLANETPAPMQVDAVTLADLPLQYQDASGMHNVPGPLGQAPPVGPQHPVLLRNVNFSKSPDINISKGQDWHVAANNLPDGVLGFWVAGGHAHPTYYVYADQSGELKLFKSTTALSLNHPTQWQELNVQGNIQDAKPYPNSQLLVAAQDAAIPHSYGPAFVNPYNLIGEIYALTGTGVRVSNDGGASFKPDPVLTSLITGNGKYPLTGTFAGGDSTGVRIASRAVFLGTLSDMDFCRTDPSLAVAASPFTGVFYRDKQRQWHDLSSTLPTPHAPVSSVRIDCQAIYVGTEGGGVFRITGF